MCSKALATQTHKNVFVITVDVETALKYTDSGGGPCTLPVRVADMDLTVRAMLMSLMMTLSCSSTAPTTTTDLYLRASPTR